MERRVWARAMCSGGQEGREVISVVLELCRAEMLGIEQIIVVVDRPNGEEEEGEEEEKEEPDPRSMCASIWEMVTPARRLMSSLSRSARARPGWLMQVERSPGLQPRRTVEATETARTLSPWVMVTGTG